MKLCPIRRTSLFFFISLNPVSDLSFGIEFQAIWALSSDALAFSIQQKAQPGWLGSLLERRV